jgi:hypothetical protein
VEDELTFLAVDIARYCGGELKLQGSAQHWTTVLGVDDDDKREIDWAIRSADNVTYCICDRFKASTTGVKASTFVARQQA